MAMGKDMPATDYSASTFQTGELIIDVEARTAMVNGCLLKLTGKEYRILELLSRRKNTPLTKEMFVNHLYGGVNEPAHKIIDVFICKLRKKLAQATGGEHLIQTVWGRGFVLREPAHVQRKRGAGFLGEC
jgi:two-component system cell cycle response regulator CtrA